MKNWKLHLSRRSHLALGIALLIGICSRADAQPVILLDDFSQTTTIPWPIVKNVANPSQASGFYEVGLTNVPGGARRVLTGPTAIDTPGTDFTSLNLIPSGPGVLDYSSTPGASSNVDLQYGESVGSPPDVGLPMNLDLHDYGIRFDFSSVQLTSPMGVQVNMNGAVVPPQPPLGSVSTSGAQSLLIVLNPGGFGGYDDIDHVRILFTPAKGTQFTLDAITLIPGVPEPGAGLVLVPALAAFRLLGRRLRRHGEIGEDILPTSCHHHGDVNSV